MKSSCSYLNRTNNTSLFTFLRRELGVPITPLTDDPGEPTLEVMDRQWPKFIRSSFNPPPPFDLVICWEDETKLFQLFPDKSSVQAFISRMMKEGGLRPQVDVDWLTPIEDEP